MSNFVNLVVPYLKSTFPRVIYSTLTCLGLLISEFSPEIQLKYGPLILDNLIGISRQENP